MFPQLSTALFINLIYRYMIVYCLSMHYLFYPPTWERKINNRNMIITAMTIVTSSSIIDILTKYYMYSQFSRVLLWTMIIVISYIICYYIQLVHDLNTLIRLKRKKRQSFTIISNPPSPQWKISKSMIRLPNQINIHITETSINTIPIPLTHLY